MPTAESTYHIARSDLTFSRIDVPDEREYAVEVNAALDRQLVAAVKAARAADNDYLERILTLELGSLYYESRRP